WLLAWLCVSLLAGIRPMHRAARTAIRFAIPVIFGVWILILWEAITRGAGIPFVLLPPPSLIGLRIYQDFDVSSNQPHFLLWADVRQTVFKAVIAGYVLGSSLGFLTAILADRF